MTNPELIKQALKLLNTGAIMNIKRGMYGQYRSTMTSDLHTFIVTDNITDIGFNCQVVLGPCFGEVWRLYPQRDRINWIDTPSTGIKQTPCTHNMVQYVGLTQVYKYCTKCDMKEST